MRALFHSLVSFVRISATIRSISWRGMGPMGLRLVSGWVQESLHGLVFSPFPMTFPRCFNSTSRPQRIPLHPWEQVDPVETLANDSLLQYFVRSILERRQFSLVKILQATFSSKAWLKAWTSRKPSPPKLLGFVKESQDFQQIFLSPFLESHQKRVSTDCIWLQRLTGN